MFLKSLFIFVKIRKHVQYDEGSRSKEHNVNGVYLISVQKVS